MNEQRGRNNANGGTAPVWLGRMKQSGYLLVPVGFTIVVFFFLPEKIIKIDEIQLEQLERDIEIGLKKNLKTFSRTKHSVSVKKCTLKIISNFTEVCVSLSEHTREVTNIYLPEFGRPSMFIDKASGDISFMFRFLAEKMYVIKRSREIYFLNKSKGRKTYKREEVFTPTKYVYDFPHQQSQKYLEENGVASSQILYTCRGYLNNQVFFYGMFLHFNPGDSTKMGNLLRQIKKYKKNCDRKTKHD